jgi:hypothetical protein
MGRQKGRSSIDVQPGEIVLFCCSLPAFLFGILQTQDAIDLAIASRADDTNRLPIPVQMWAPLIHAVFLL